MEIERKFLLTACPTDYTSYPSRAIQQGYLNTAPVLRIRKSDDQYRFTYKSAGLVAREEIEVPLDAASYQHLLAKCDGDIISKRRYKIPDLRPDSQRFVSTYTPEVSPTLTIELDVFEGALQGLLLAEVEFPDLACSEAYLPPDWFRVEVSDTSAFHNSTISKTPAEETLRIAKSYL